MNDLALKDIHLPASIGWWPPAIGWWLLLVLVVAAPFCVYWLYRRLTRDSALKSARRLLGELKQQTGEDRLACVAGLSALLRRVAISGNRRSEVARLHGKDWLNFLDTGFADTPFSTGIGQILADAHYRPSLPDDFDLEALFTLCERWLRQQEKRRC